MGRIGRVCLIRLLRRIRRSAFEFDGRQTHREIPVLRIIGEQPAIEMLAHHRRVDCEMQRWRAAVAHWLRIQLALNRRRVIDNLQMRSAGEQTEITWPLRRRRMMQKFRRKSFHDAIDVVDTKLALIDKKTVGWRIAFEQRDSSFDPPNSADERSGQYAND